MAEKDPKIKTCPKCGAKNKGENGHCDKCGWPLELTVEKDD